LAIEFKVGAEEIHKVGEVGVERVRRWLNSTYRFRIDNSVYDTDFDGKPYTKVRVPQLQDGVFERFDLVGCRLDKNGYSGRDLFVECKEYSEAGGQPQLYDEYLAVCYSAFVKLGKQLSGPPSIEFMWVTTHPFAQTNYVKLTTAAQVAAACGQHAERLGNHPFDPSIADQVADRLWLAIVNPRVEEMIMGSELQKAVAAKIIDLQAS
jgi:hypothetical protein